MDVKKVLKLAEDMVFAKTGEHLDDLQEAILAGVWEGQKYSQIAEASYCSEGHVRNIASKLWKRLSNVLGEEVTQSNLRSALERQQVFIVSQNFGNDFVFCNVNVSTDSQSPEVPNARSPSTPTPDTSKPQTRLDLADAPHISLLSDRTSELATLEKWIVQEKCNLAAISGLSGIGKTALSLHLIPQIQHHFDCVIWRSLGTSPPLGTTLKNLIQFIANQYPPNPPLSRGGEEGFLPSSIGDRLSLLMEYLRKNRCLIILDDVQTLLGSGQLAGNYRPDCENYSILFRQIGETTHNSCLILNTWETPREITALTGENSLVRTLQLKGIGTDAAEIFRNKNLLNPEKWEYLINAYRGNPLWLKIVAATIQELFRGRVAEFLKYDMLFVGEELAANLQPQIDRLSELEKKLISRLSREANSVSIEQLLEDADLSPSELFNGLQSLGRRSLVEIEEMENETLFNLCPVVRQYVISNPVC
ncbi:MAG: ATPase [Microcoleus sp. PH2017_22_RUC_O_B]|uniref:NB-ARC domain-containing protein n=1 Tax=unclassified Microcoleus TaxID=2642155 RepID=UPI001DB69417|nr:MULTISPECIES: NB-ARC domain-containing protein [unclassified Microcoleus]MCC3531000.1 ATPase [Microcoleus sp. PH2017_21_RUC_O_A]MCC3543357.1 ATPase [Microcoleus sp. PH2017_22_RUC_O_B]